MSKKKTIEEILEFAKDKISKGESISDEKWALIRRELNYPAFDLQISEDGTEVRMYEDED